MYDFLLAVHILCAVLWAGGGVTFHLMGRRARQAGGEAMLRYVHDSTWIGPRFYAPLSLILLVAGILLVGEAGYEHSDLFITLGYLGWLNSFVIGAGIYPRMEKSAVAAAEAGGTDSQEFQDRFARIGRLNLYELAVLLLVVVDMAVKPGL